MQVKTTVKAGKITNNHSEAQVRPAAGLKVQTNIKAGFHFVKRCDSSSPT